jgi:Zn-dependent protease
MGWWIAEFARAGAYVELVSWIFWVLASITLHELAHAWAAIWQGDDTPIRVGRMAANPIVQMGRISLIVFAVCGIAWGLMPVNPTRFRDGRRGDVYVAVAGPLMNLAIAAAALVLLWSWQDLGPQGTALAVNVRTFLYLGLVLNLILAVFNLLPVPPLDGSRILAGISRRFEGWYNHPQAAIIGTFIFLAIFFMSPVGGYLFAGAYAAADALARLVG